MFERLTERAREALVLAESEARRLNYDRIGAEHLLLGLVGEQYGAAATALERSGADIENARAALARVIGEGERPGVGGRAMPFGVSARQALELALREALALGVNYIGTEHLRLGLLKQPDSTTAQKVPAELAVDPEHLRGIVLTLIAPHNPPDGTDAERPDEQEPSASELSAAERLLLAAERLVDAFENIDRNLRRIAERL